MIDDQIVTLLIPSPEYFRHGREEKGPSTTSASSVSADRRQVVQSFGSALAASHPRKSIPSRTSFILPHIPSPYKYSSNETLLQRFVSGICMLYRMIEPD